MANKRIYCMQYSIGCLRIRCCRTRTRCLRGAPRFPRVGKSGNVHTVPQNGPCLGVTGPHVSIYHTRGRTLLSQAPHTNESILCHEPSPGTIVVTCPSCTVYPTDPERSRTPTASRATSLRNNDVLPHNRKPQISNYRYPATSINNRSNTKSPPTRF